MRVKILVVDDEESICEILKYNLEKEGYEVDTADSAETALGYDLRKYQLILVDIMMERMGGFDFAMRVRNNPEIENIPIIFCSALNGEDEKAIRADAEAMVKLIGAQAQPAPLGSVEPAISKNPADVARAKFSAWMQEVQNQ